MHKLLTYPSSQIHILFPNILALICPHNFHFLHFFLFYEGGLIAVPSSGFLYDQTHNWDVVFLLFAFHYIAGAFLWSLWASDQPLTSPNIPVKKTYDTIM